jgi:RNA polymerase sigma-70 factor (ECF subfamily)
VDDAGELERAYRQEATRIRAALAARLGDVALAEESVQDAFIEALEHRASGRRATEPGRWLATTAWRKAVTDLPGPCGPGKAGVAGRGCPAGFRAAWDWRT